MRKPTLLSINHVCLCLCPEWNTTGYDVGLWNGEQFDNPDSLNDEFDKYVMGYIPMDEDGIPTLKKYLKYKT